MLYYLLGSDTYRVREREKELAGDFVQKFPHAERAVFDDGEDIRGLSARIRERLSGGLFSAPALVHVRELTLSLEGDEADMKEVLDEAKENKEALIIITETGKTRKASKFRTWLGKHATTERFSTFDPKKPEELVAYGKTLLPRLDPRATIDSRALFQLAEWSGGKSGYVARELEKLVVYKNGTKITMEDVTELCPEPVESRAFGALDALISGRRAEALALFRREEKLAVPFQQTLGLCAWQLRLLLGTKELQSEGMTKAADIARELGASPYPIQKILPKLSLLSLDRLKKGIALLADLDLGIRSGQVEPGVALDLFVWKF